MIGPDLTTGPFTAETASPILEQIAHLVCACTLATALIDGTGSATADRRPNPPGHCAVPSPTMRCSTAARAPSSGVRRGLQS